MKKTIMLLACWSALLMPTAYGLTTNSAGLVQYLSFNGNTYQLKPWFGSNICILATTTNQFDPNVLSRVIGALDTAFSFYITATGNQPTAYGPTTLYGRDTIAEVTNTCGAGCSYIGFTGSELLIPYFDILYNGVASADQYDQVMFYEFGRNFWFYGNQLAYHSPDNDPVTTGFAVYMRFAAMDAVGVTGGPFNGYSFDTFRTSETNLIDLYLTNSSLNWSNTFRTGQAPANPLNLGASDLIASLLMRIGRDFGGPSFASNFWRQAGLRPTALTTQTAVDNFALAACATVNSNLTGVFLTTWKIPISGSALEEAQSRWGAALQGPPAVQIDLTPLSAQIAVGTPFSYSVFVTGTAPLRYQWFQDGQAVSAATNSIYSFNAAAGSHTICAIVTNSLGSAASSIATVVGVVGAFPTIGFGGSGSNWTLNNGGGITPGITNNVLTLTDGQNYEASSAFYSTPQYIGGFAASFTYQGAPGSAPLADGATFCIQNSAPGASAVGQAASSLGYYDIPNSTAFEINIYNGSSGGAGIQFGTNGSTAMSPNSTLPYFSTSPVNLTSSDLINVALLYSQGAFHLTMEDVLTGATYSTTKNIGDLTTIIGSPLAFVGFTGATGGLNSIQRISNFQFTPTNAVTVSPPTVTITNPLAGAVFVAPATITISATASSSNGTVTGVQFLLGATVIGNSTVSPYSATVSNLAGASYTLTAVATDKYDLRATNSIQVMVLNPGPPVIASLNLAGTNLVINAANGLQGATYTLLMSTNLAKPLNQWTSVAASVLTTSGNFTITATNAASPGTLEQFYILQTQ
jgi:hypothetical protein